MLDPVIPEASSSAGGVNGGEGVTVALPVHADGSGLEHALADVLGQTLREIEVLVVLNGAGERARGAARAAERDGRVRVLELGRANLGAALNLALREARHDLVARMDDDDRCAPGRLAAQRDWMRANPAAGAVGCWWDRRDAAGTRLSVERPPAEPRELRWRLLTENPLAHGSMMLRRSAVRAVGGYDERLERGQDFDLWLRLSRAAPIGVVPEVLYSHSVRDGSGSYCAGPAQAATAAGVMVREWAALEPMPPSDRHTLSGILAQAMSAPGGSEDGLARLADFLNERGPSREGLTAWLWARDSLPRMSRRAAEVCALSRLREVGAQLRAEGVREVVLWGAGVHAEWIARRAEALGVEIAGLVDDACAGAQRAGMTVRSPDSLRAGEVVLIASDAHEDGIWRASQPARSRGVAVRRLYGELGEPATAGTAG